MLKEGEQLGKNCSAKVEGRDFGKTNGPAVGNWRYVTGSSSRT